MVELAYNAGTGHSTLLFTVDAVDSVDCRTSADGKYTIKYANYAGEKRVGTAETLEVDVVIGADGANSRVAKAIDAGEYNFAIAFQERIKITEKQIDVGIAVTDIQPKQWILAQGITTNKILDLASVLSISVCCVCGSGLCARATSFLGEPPCHHFLCAACL